VWDSNTFEKLGELNSDGVLDCVALNDKVIAGCDRYGKLYVYENSPGYSQKCTIDLGAACAPSLEFVDADVLMCTQFYKGIFFVSISKKSRLPIPRIEDGKYLCASCIVSNSMVCSGGLGGHCTVIKMRPKAATLLETHFENKSVSPM